MQEEDPVEGEVLAWRKSKEKGKVALRVDLKDGAGICWVEDAAIVCSDFPDAVSKYVQKTVQRFKEGELKCTRGLPATLLVENLKSMHGKKVQGVEEPFQFAGSFKVELEKLAEVEKQVAEKDEEVAEEEVSHQAFLLSFQPWHLTHFWECPPFC